MGNFGGFVEDLTGINLGGESSSDQAVRAQQGAASEANATQKYMYDTTRADNQPWLEAGKSALAQAQNGEFKKDFSMADFQADPGYAFRMAEGTKALERSAAARGGLNSGATMKALSNYGQNTASAEYQNAYERFNADRDRRFNRLSSLAGTGQTATAANGAAGQNYASNVGANMMGAANAQAAATMGQAQQRSGTMGQASQAAMTAIMFSDTRLKTDLVEISKEDLAEMKSHLKAYAFKYKEQRHGDGEWIGVLAQDLEKSKLGKTLVLENAEGHKMVNVGKVMSLFLATMAEG